MFALEGVNWRAWSAADRVAATYVMLVRRADRDQLRVIYELTGDTEALGVLDREVMGQTGGVELTDVGVARG